MVAAVAVVNVAVFAINVAVAVFAINVAVASDLRFCLVFLKCFDNFPSFFRIRYPV